MKQFLQIMFVLIFSGFTSYAQSGITVLKGDVIDKETNEGIAFVSIGIEGTSTGTATNPDGHFVLKVSDENLTKNLYFSAIGYVNVSFPISDFVQKQNIQITLAPQSYKIEAVDVAAESMVLQRILRTASERIPENYLEGPLNLKIYYEEQCSVGDAVGSTTKSIVDLYDTKGYSSPGWTDAFKSRKYQTTEYQSDVSPVGFRDASNSFDEILEMDVARLSNTIMSPSLLNDYSLKLEDKTLFNRDSVWIISYAANKPDLAHTGSFYPKSFSGKIYISCSEYAVLRNEIHLTETKENMQGRSLAVKGYPLTNIQMNITTEYKKVNGKYFLSYIKKGIENCT